MAESESSLPSQVHFGQVVAQNQVGLALQRQLERGRGHVGVAVAVAPDPLA